MNFRDSLEAGLLDTVREPDNARFLSAKQVSLNIHVHFRFRLDPDLRLQFLHGHAERIVDRNLLAENLKGDGHRVTGRGIRIVAPALMSNNRDTKMVWESIRLHNGPVLLNCAGVAFGIVDEAIP